MTKTDDTGYDEFQRQLSAEGVAFEDVDLRPTTPQPGDALPDRKTVKALRETITREFQRSEADRREHMKRVDDAWRTYDMQKYSPEEMLLPEQESIRVPLTLSRVDQAHGSLYGALAVRPFAKAEVGEGQDGTVAIHAEAALGEELDRCEFENALDVALRGSLVGTAGFLKAVMVEDEEEAGEYRLDVDAVDIRELYLSPHEVRNLEQCTMIAHRYTTETWGWVWDNVLDGVFDRKAAERVGGSRGTDGTDAGATEREALGLTASTGIGGDDSRQVDMLEVYIRFRPAPDARRKWWRVFMEYGSKEILRAEPWTDGQPFTAIRHARGQTTMYARSFANILKDLQWASDQLFSASIEADRMGVAPTWKVNVLSPAMEWLENRQDERGVTVRPLPGDVIPTRGGENELVPMYMQPTPPQIDSRMNRLEQLANIATIPVVPMQTYRSATEHRYAQANVSGKEQQMLKVMRADLSRFLEYIKRLHWKYRAVPLTEDTRQVIHGTQAYTTTAQQWGMLKLTPRGMTTAADQMLTMQASQEALGLVMQILPQKPMMEQAGIWGYVWEALRARLDALGIEDWEKYIGPSPTTDPNLEELDPIVAQRKAQASMMLMAAQQNAANMMQQQGGMQPGGLPGPQGEAVRGDGAPTVPPGGAPMPEGLN